MEGMLDPGVLQGAAEAEGEEDELDPAEAAALEEQMAEAVAFNQHLKQLLAEAEAKEAADKARRGPARSNAGRGSHAQLSSAEPSRLRGAAPANGTRMIGHAKNGGWGGKTHTQGRESEIDRDNMILVQKLTSIAVKPTMNTRQQPHYIPPANSSVAINRRRKDDQIARENAAFAKRLNSVKATSNLSAKSHAQHAHQSAQHARNVSKFSQQQNYTRAPSSGKRSAPFGYMPPLLGGPRGAFE